MNLKQGIDSARTSTLRLKGLPTMAINFADPLRITRNKSYHMVIQYYLYTAAKTASGDSRLHTVFQI